ncbi:hypothetical protein phiA829_126 [Aeromonas phage phiA8-29]|uniref:DUF7424 domain-containing protein n=1 Tax=Aeromonas phage phiA8-29 TaxID=1978922 RepID=A0A1W6DYJ3_9CAUD|nr:hypothetical protein HWB15_gp151 [Aeromonas phage phiA8-29]ARK07946.1 hypothetical protein phiA829_126 [Aeromonas phage phiA8-29]
MQNFFKKVSVLLAVLVLISCRVKVEPKLTMTQVLSTESSLVPTFVTIETETCTEEEKKKYFLGVVASFEGCRRKNNGFVKEWRVDIPLVQSSDIETLKTTPIALFRGKNNTLIMFMKRDVMNGLRKELFRNNENNLAMSLKYEIANDTKFDIVLAVSSAWVNDSIAVGQQLSVFTVPADNYITITMSDTGVAALLRSGSEPVSIIPFDK